MSDNFANLNFQNGEVTFNSNLNSTIEIGHEIYFTVGVSGTYEITAKERFPSLFDNEPDRLYFTGKLINLNRLL